MNSENVKEMGKERFTLNYIKITVSIHVQRLICTKGIRTSA